MNNRCFRFPASRRSAAASGIGRAVLAAAGLALASCWHPAFDPEVSGSEAVVRKLGAPVLWFTAENVEGWEMDDLRFLPTVTSPPTTPGILVRRESQYVRINPVSFDAVTHTGFVDSFNSREIPNPLAGVYSVRTAPGGNSEAFGMGRYDTGVHFSPLSPPTPTTTGYPSGLGTLGLGFCAIGGSNSSSLLWLGYSAGDMPAYYQNSWTNGAPVFGGTSSLFFPDHALVAAAGLAFELASGHLILSCGLVDGSRAIYRWDNPSDPDPERFPEVYGPVVAALSDSRLLAEKDGILTVLDRNLRGLFSFPAGRLRFVHERWDGSQMISVFTRAVYVRTERGDDIGRLDVEVYEIPTADLHKLAD